MRTPSIALIGLACVYPDARSPAELWENVLAGRRAFRRMPPDRLRVEDYWSADRDAPDRTYAAEAAVIEGYEFDRVGFRVAGPSFRSADLAHWLALDVAARALADAGLDDGDGLPRESTGVFLGNTLTGEFSRANAMRLRWPYARRVVDAAIRREGWAPGRREAFLDQLEESYKSPFPPVGDETLAGSLSNTIAGRICNHFDLKGGGYTVDGACASSLLAVSHACSSLAAGDLDAAIAGGVDLSLDPFELVGFAKVGALARDEMRVYDRRSAGFLPGEGCGVVVLMRLEDAIARGRRVVAIIRGWGISSDGRGGITRPEAEGQLLALRRAYRRAGFSIGTVPYFEGHGTGTAVGDSAELSALARAIREGGEEGPPAAIGSIKANIGHTKAAAGVAGLIKAALALEARVLPPTTGCEQPHAELAGDRSPLRALRKGEPWPAGRPLRAGVSAMGFGGINAHVVLESIAEGRRPEVSPRERALLDTPQDAELFLLDGRDAADLRRRVGALAEIAGQLSTAELTDLAAHLAGSPRAGSVRAAIVASRPAELAARLEVLRRRLDRADDEADSNDSADVFLGMGVASPRIGFLFPGQGTTATLDGGAWSRRFRSVEDLYRRAGLPASGDPHSTDVAQPAIIAASLAALGVLRELGIDAETAVGHSLGELAALHWSGAIDPDSLLRIAAARGRAMAGPPDDAGAMAGVEAGAVETEALINGDPVVIAGFNAPRQTVIAGPTGAVEAVVDRARRRGWAATRLAVSRAFHSPLLAGAVAPLADALHREAIGEPRRPITSSVTGGPILADADVRGILLRQVTAPVRFLEAMNAAAEGIDLWIEAGPGRVLTGLAAGWIGAPVVATEAGGESLRGLLRAVGACYALGAPVRPDHLFHDRFCRPFPTAWRPRFLPNPCELAPLPVREPPGADSRRSDRDPGGRGSRGTAGPEPRPPGCGEGRCHDREGEPPGEPDRGRGASGVSPSPDASTSRITPERPEAVIDVVRRAVSERAELPPWSVGDGSRLLGDLHLNSITVSQIVVEIAGRLGAAIPVEPMSFASATVAEVAEALEELVRSGPRGQGDPSKGAPPGVAAWFRAFVPGLVERPRPPRPESGPGSPWWIVARPDDPLADRLQEAMPRASAGRGVVACLPPDPDERHVGLLLEAAGILIADPSADRFVLVQHGGGAASFARTVHQERPRVAACVVNVPVDHPRAVEWIVAEAGAMSGFAEVHYDEAGRRREPILHVRPWPGPPAGPILGPDDVLLVSGGGKGIAAECALALARDTGARLALLGRARPDADPVLAANLERMRTAGVGFHYAGSDVTDPEAVRAAVRRAESALGPVTGVLHAAGVNAPCRLESLDEDAFLETLAPKLGGFRNLLDAVRPDRLKLLVTFGSIIGRTGMPGEADYGVANEWLTRETERFGRDHPECRCLALEWSVWSGLGMGDRLGRVDALTRQGIEPIPPDAGVALFRQLVSASGPTVPLVVAGRFGIPPALPVEGAELPLLRFLERPLVDYPGIELVVDADLTTETDPYLDEHVFRGERLFPAVMGLEAMAQVAMAVLRVDEPPAFEDVTFGHPIVAPAGQKATIRLAALVTAPGRVEVALRSAATGFQLDHFWAACRFGAGPARTAEDRGPPVGRPEAEPAVGLDPGAGLYGQLLFQAGRFRRLAGYRRLGSTGCEAEIAGADPRPWFHHYWPGRLVLGDPAARDAVIHSIQSCIPQATILPVGVDRLIPGTGCGTKPGRAFARERCDLGDLLLYDVDVLDDRGEIRERWEGLRLRVVERREPRGDWPRLLGPYLERRIRGLLPGSAPIAVAVERDGATPRRRRSDRLFRQLLGPGAPLARRPDGKPETDGGRTLTAAHAGDWTIAAVAAGVIACDLEPVAPRPESTWRELLGPGRRELAGLVAREAGEAPDQAATRVWVAGECLTKAGVSSRAPLVLDRLADGRAVVLRSGELAIATLPLPDGPGPGRPPLILGFLVGRRDARL